MAMKVRLEYKIPFGKSGHIYIYHVSRDFSRSNIPAIHIISKYISNMNLIVGVCNTKTSPKYLVSVNCMVAIFT